MPSSPTTHLWFDFCDKKSPQIKFNSRGFTLIELLVVVVIVAILFTYTTLAIRTDSAQDILKQEAQKLQNLIILAIEESILRGEQYALEIKPNSYQFSRLDNNRWRAIKKDKLLRKRELPEDIVLELSLEETDVVLNAAADDKKTEEDESADEAEDSATDSEKLETNNKKSNKVKPQIFLLSSGEITPEFEIEFLILGVDTQYLVKGFFDGTVKMQASE